MENNCLIPNFDGFQVTLNKSADSIYFRIVNSVTYQCYEKSITQIDLRNSNVNTIQKAFVLYKKSFMKENHYNLVIEVKEGILSLIFKAIFDECFELSSIIYIPEIVSVDEIDVSSALIRVEMKQKEDISRIMDKMLQMESLLQYLFSSGETCIGTFKQYSNQMIVNDKFYIPLNIEILNIINAAHNSLAVNHTQMNIREYLNINCIDVIFYGTVRKLKFLKKLNYTRDVNIEKNIRNAYVSNSSYDQMSINYLKDTELDMVMPEKFDFGKFYNGILEEFSITNLNGVATLESVEKMKTLNTLEIVNADQLSNASTYIVKLLKLKSLTFKNCPKIVSDDSAKLQDYCRKKNITLSIS